MSEAEDIQSLKAFAIERSRDPAEGVDARGRALFACIVIPVEIQKWMVSAGAVEPLLDSIEATILAAETSERERCASIALAIDSGRGNEKEIAAAIRRPLTSTHGTER